MPKNSISLPFEPTSTLRDLGMNIRTARLRRNMTLSEVANRIGVHRETLAMAEKGNPNVAIGSYIGALWVLGLLPQLSRVAHPDEDRQGRALEDVRERARPDQGLSNDF